MTKYILTDKRGHRFSDDVFNGPTEAVNEARRLLMVDHENGPITIWREAWTVTYKPADIELAEVKEG